MKKLLTLLLMLPFFGSGQKISNCKYKRIEKMVIYDDAKIVTYKKNNVLKTDTLYQKDCGNVTVERCIVLTVEQGNMPKKEDYEFFIGGSYHPTDGYILSYEHKGIHSSEDWRNLLPYYNNQKPTHDTLPFYTNGTIRLLIADSADTFLPFYKPIQITYDTVPVLLLVCDTAKRFTTYWMKGYEVIERNPPPRISYGYDTYFQAEYLDEKRKPLSKTIVVWMSKRIYTDYFISY